MYKTNPYEVTRVDSMQWNRTANIRVMREMAENCEQSAPAEEVSASVLAEVKQAIQKELDART